MSAPLPLIAPNTLTGVHHIALNVRDMAASRHFYGQILGLQELSGDQVPATLVHLVAAGKVTNFMTPDGLILDLFWEPELPPPDLDPKRAFTRLSHLAFDIAPAYFEQAVAVVRQQTIVIDHGPVTRPTGRGIYFYDPDGLMIEIRCNPG